MSSSAATRRRARALDDRAGAVFAALADGTRRRLFRAVVDEGPTTATALSAALPVSRQAVAKHLGVLAQAGLVSAERAGRETRYRATPEAMVDAAAWMAQADQAWATRLDRLRARAEADR